MTEVKIGEEYGKQYAGTYDVRVLSWKEGRELIRSALKNKDPTAYIEELVLASVKGPIELSHDRLLELPSGLVRRLMDETLRLNDISRQESSFL